MTIRHGEYNRNIKKLKGLIDKNRRQMGSESQWCSAQKRGFTHHKQKLDTYNNKHIWNDYQNIDERRLYYYFVIYRVR